MNVAAILAGLGGVTAEFLWIPQVHTHYSQKYFAALNTPAPGMVSKIVLAVAHVAMVAFLSQHVGVQAMTGWSLALVALQGVVQLDRSFKVIPDRFQWTGLAGALLVATAGPIDEALAWRVGSGLLFVLGLLAFNVAYEKMRKRTAMGLGDIKLLGWLAVALGIDVLHVTFLATIVGAGMILPLLVMRRAKMESAFAFGPAIAVALALYLVVN